MKGWGINTGKSLKKREHIHKNTSWESGGSKADVPHTAQNWKRCVNEITPWSPPLDLDVHTLDLGIKTWDSPGQVTAFSTTPGLLEQDTVQWTLYWTAPV